MNEKCACIKKSTSTSDRPRPLYILNNKSLVHCVTFKHAKHIIVRFLDYAFIKILIFEMFKPIFYRDDTIFLLTFKDLAIP